MLVIRIAQQQWCIEMSLLKEIVRAQEITPVPKSLPYIEGAMNIRGEIIAVINPYKKIIKENSSENSTERQADTQRVVILEKKHQKFGILVDEIMKILNVANLQILPAEEKYQAGIIKTDNNTLPILDIDNLLG